MAEQRLDDSFSAPDNASDANAIIRWCRTLADPIPLFRRWTAEDVAKQKNMAQKRPTAPIEKPDDFSVTIDAA
jgi:hypothetical protein